MNSVWNEILVHPDSAPRYDNEIITIVMMKYTPLSES